MLLAVLALVCVAGAAASHNAAPGSRLAGDGADCLALKDRADCLAHGCGWCTNSALGGDLGCMASAVAKLVPQALAECELPEAPELQGKHKPKPKPPATCGDNKVKHDCLHLGADEGECAWCSGQYMESCMPAAAAKFLPEMVAKCKLPKKAATEELAAGAGAGSDDPPKPKPPVSCGDNKAKHDCLELGAQEGQCAWCKGDFMPPSCVGLKAAAWIPSTVAECKRPAKPSSGGGDVDGGAANVAQELGRKGGHSGGSGGGFIPGGGDWPSGGGDWPSGPGGKGGKGGKGGAGCMAATSKKACLKATGTGGGCAWCKSSFMAAGQASCLDEMSVKFMPSFVADCKFAGKHKADDATEVAQAKVATS